MMQVQWAEMNKNINATAATATNTAGMSLLERRAAEAAASIGGGNVAMPPSSLDLKIPTGFERRFYALWYILSVLRRRNVFAATISSLSTTTDDVDAGSRSISCE